jgi:glycosyltransferase involved in cell wall biosynthesis
MSEGWCALCLAWFLQASNKATGSVSCAWNDPGNLQPRCRLKGGLSSVSISHLAGRHPAFIQKATTVLAGLKPDIIHTHQIGAAWYLGQAAHSLGRPVIHTEHGNLFSQACSWRQVIKTCLFIRSTVRHIDKFCCVSDEIAAAVTRWRTVPVAKVAVVPNGIATDVRQTSHRPNHCGPRSASPRLPR